MKRTSLLVFLFAQSCFLQAQNLHKTIFIGGLQREYILHLPPGFASVKTLPVLFAFHGGGATAQSAASFYNLETLGDNNNFIIVYPNAINKAWIIPGMATRVKNSDTTVNDLQFINLLLDTLVAHYKADPDNVFCTGISRGAMFSYYLATAMNDRITAIAAVCGSISQTQATGYVFKKPVPALIINGTADPLVAYKGGYGKLNKRNEGNENADLLPAEELVKKIASLNHCNAKPEIAALPDVDPSDGCTETEYRYNCEVAKVVFIKIENGGHTWAGGKQYLPKFIIGSLCRDFSASQKVFDFFMSVKTNEKQMRWPSP